MELTFITPEDPLYASELELRFRVLREPLGHARSDVAFPFERESLHLVAHEGGQVVGCVLFHPEDAGSGRLFQMAVARRGQGLGTRLVRALEIELIPSSTAQTIPPSAWKTSCRCSKRSGSRSSIRSLAAVTTSTRAFESDRAFGTARSHSGKAFVVQQLCVA